MSTTWVDFRELRQKLRFSDILKSFNVELKVRGDRATGYCPLPGHQGKRNSPSFSANLAKGIFQCFGCGAKGNVLDFATLMKGGDPADSADLRNAAIELQEKFGGGGERPGNRPERPKGNSAKPRQKKPAEDADEETKPPDPEPAAQKKADPAVTGPAIVNAPLDFELKGLDLSHPYLKGRGFTTKTIEFFGLGYCSRGLMQGRIAIPLHDGEGKLVGYAGRLVDDGAISAENPKYRFPGDRVRDGKSFVFKKSHLLYNQHRITTPATDLVVVEGFASVWWLVQNGYPNVVALMGCSCSPEQAKLIVEMLTPEGRVLALTDGDDAGQRCAQSILMQVTSHRWCRWVPLEESLQPTDLNVHELAALAAGREAGHE